MDVAPVTTGRNGQRLVIGFDLVSKLIGPLLGGFCMSKLPIVVDPFEKKTGNTYALKSPGSTGPRNALAAAHNVDWSCNWVIIIEPCVLVVLTCVHPPAS